MRIELPTVPAPGVTSGSENPHGAEPQAAEAANPFLRPWKTPFGLPPFDEIEAHDFLPAFRAGMEQQRAEIDAVTAQGEDATFTNTIEALERSGRLLARVSDVFFPLQSAHSSEALREVARTVAPELARHRDAIALDRRLFGRVRAVYEARAELGLDAEQRRLVEETHKGFLRAGAALGDGEQARLREINQELAELAQRFSQNLLHETNAYELHLTRRADLEGLPESAVVAAAAEARRRGHDGGWSFTLAKPSVEPFLRYARSRELRRRIFEAYFRRGDNDDEHDNKHVLSRLAALRAEKASLLGYLTHAHYVLADSMAGNPRAVYELLDQLWQPALAMAREERSALEALKREEGEEGPLEPWDWRYYAEKVRRARFELDDEEVRCYFEVGAVRDGVFELARRLFGLTFRKLEDAPLWHDDQQAFEVREADGRHLGVLYLDFYARESKRPGAWMNMLRAQSRLDGEVSAVVTTTFNYPPPVDGGPSLLTYNEAETLFHELGHAFHALLSDVTYESLSGTRVPRDFVELPSQVLENWMGEPEVLRGFARHHRTGEVIPEELESKLRAAERFNQGFATVEYLAATYLDLAWHTLVVPAEQEPRAFERVELERIGLIDEIPPRYRSSHFAHVFSGGYSSGYYGYVWSQVLDADAFEAFREAGLFDPEWAARLRRLLSQGGTRPGAELYREFRGREPRIDALLRRRGLLPQAAAAGALSAPSASD